MKLLQEKVLSHSIQLLIACERVGPAQDGNCHTMRGFEMPGLVQSLIHTWFLDELQQKLQVPFLAIGDGGNELGMGKVLDKIHANEKIKNEIACVVPADYLIAASVSNWGGYALAAGAAVVRSSNTGESRDEWVAKCLPTRQQEIDLLDRCVLAGCRDGVSGEMEATVDGMPLERSLQCLEDLRQAALGN